MTRLQLQGVVAVCGHSGASRWIAPLEHVEACGCGDGDGGGGDSKWGLDGRLLKGGIRMS
jgi:hypothetical protein